MEHSEVSKQCISSHKCVTLADTAIAVELLVYIVGKIVGFHALF